MDVAEWLEAYEDGVKASGFSTGIGAYYDAKTALKVVTDAIGEPMPKMVGKPEVGNPSAFLLGSTSVEYRWGSGSGDWLPKGGCMGMGDWNETGFDKPHPVNATTESLLPLVMKPGLISERDQKVIDELFQNYVDASMAAKWRTEFGLPTVVSNVKVIWQYDDEGREKPRVIMDLRYANGCVKSISLVLPKVTDFVRNLPKGTLMGKEDMKSGYLQMPFEESDQHLVTFLWRGCLMTMIVSVFGWRDAPGAFQRRTSYASNQVTKIINNEAPRIIRARVYIDDFIQALMKSSLEASKETYDRWIEELLKFGVVLGKSKCVGPTTRCTILGIVVDTEEMMLTVSEQKSKRYTDYCGELLIKANSGPLRAKEIAKMLGRLVSVEAAMPLMMVFSRPMFEDLKIGLKLANDLFQHTNWLPSIRNEGDAVTNFEWIDTNIEISSGSKEAMQYIIDNWAELNGQSITPPETTLVFKSDASDTGICGRVFRVGKDKKLVLILTLTEPITMEQASRSSTARETLVQLRLAQTLDDEVLRSAVVESINDNLGFAKRHWMGSISPDVNEYLLAFGKRLKQVRATWGGATWFAREFMSVEDAGSREERVATEELVVDADWFQSFLVSLKMRRCKVPTVDAYSSESNHRLPNFVVREPKEGLKYDGNKQDWKHYEVPWMFPPVHAITKAVTNWRASNSMHAYLCVPDVPMRHNWLRGLAELSPEPMMLAMVNGVHKDVADKWRFRVYHLRKPNTGVSAN